MNRTLPPGYLDACARLEKIVRALVSSEGARPAFVMPPEGVWVPAALDAIGLALAENDAARALVSRVAGVDYTLMQLVAVFDVLGIAYERAPTLRAFVDRIEVRSGQKLLIIGAGLTDRGDALLRDAKGRPS